MFFEVKVNSLNGSDIVYTNRQYQSGLPEVTRDTILQLRDKILTNQLIYDQDFKKCNGERCSLIHLSEITALGRCDCIDISASLDRDLINIFRSKLDALIKRSVENLIKENDELNITFWCSGRLLSELVVMTNIIELIKNSNHKEFKLKINFIDQAYSDYVDLGLFNKDVYRISKEPPGEVEPMTVGDIYADRLSRNDAYWAKVYKVRDMNLEHLEKNPGRGEYIAAINSYLCFLKFILPPSIHTKAKFFTSDRHYQHMCVAKNEWHDLLVGHDIQWTWDPMRALHTSTGKADGQAIAWSKKYEEGKAVGVEVKHMLQADADWTTVENTPFSRTYP